MGGDAEDTTPKPVNVAKLYVQGLAMNGTGVGMLVAAAHFLGVGRAVAVAISIQLAVFLLHGLHFRSEKFYDLSGSFTHLAVVASALLFEVRTRSPRQLFLALAATIWMTRLGTFLYNRILRDGKDARFDRIKPVWLSFLGAWTIQAVWVVLIELPVVLINMRDDTAAITALDVAAMVCWVLGFLIEGAADSQKMAFRDDPENRHRYITTGLWRYSRHPNYFGEILMWSSLAFTVSHAGLRLRAPALHGAWISPAFTALLLLKATGVPLIEKAGMKKWGEEPAYRHYMENTSCLVPWFPAPQLAGKTD